MEILKYESETFHMSTTGYGSYEAQSDDKLRLRPSSNVQSLMCRIKYIVGSTRIDQIRH